MMWCTESGQHSLLKSQRRTHDHAQLGRNLLPHSANFCSDGFEYAGHNGANRCKSRAFFTCGLVHVERAIDLNLCAVSAPRWLANRANNFDAFVRIVDRDAQPLRSKRAGKQIDEYRLRGCAVAVADDDIGMWSSARQT
jgi:hypothetical protein